MLRRITVGLLLLALAGATMGQDSCSTETGSDEPSTSETSEADREAARERKREKRRERKRRAREKRERDAYMAPSEPEPEPEPEPAPSEPSSDCHPSYKGDCLDPNASDYDCAGGSGDGPEYANGPITVTGSDPYDLDRDGDGTACES